MSRRRKDPGAEPEYVRQIPVHCELCLALQVREEILRDRFISEFHASWFITIGRRGERLGTVVIAIFEVRVSNVVPVVRIVYISETSLLITIYTYATRLVKCCANVLFG